MGTVPRPVFRSALVGVALVAGGVLAVASPAAAAGPEQITNGTFTDGTAGWEGYPAFSVPDGAGCDTVPAGTGAYGAAIRQGPLPIVAGETYSLTFRISAPAWLDPEPVPYLRVVIQGGPEVNYAPALPSAKLALTSESQDRSYTFTVPADAGFPAGATLEFSQDIGNDKAYTFCVDDVSLTGGATPEHYQPETGPRVRVNQVGYLPAGPKQATLVTDTTDPVRWELHDDNGTAVTAGWSTPRGVDPSADLNVQTIDFSAWTGSGSGFTVVADGDISYPFDIGSSAYEQLRLDTKTFFYTNRSGIAISDELAPGYGRPAGHVGLAPNQGDIAVPCQDVADDSQQLYDEPWTCVGTHDVSGGWYDAGDHGKYVVNGGIAVAQLMQEYERTKTAGSTDRGALSDGSLQIPEAGNGVPDILDEARWELEWMLKMQVPAGQQYAGLAYHKVADVDWTGLPTLPNDDQQRRVLYRPSTAAALNLAAAAAQGARLFASYDAVFAERLLTAATAAYAAAMAEPQLYAPAPDAVLDPNPGSGPYDDTDVSDEFYWAAAELYLTTGAKTYRDAVLASPLHSADIFTAGGFDWGHVAPLARLDLATVPNSLPGRSGVRASVVAAAEAYIADQESQPFGQIYRPDGNNYAWGSNSQILNNMQVVGTAYDISGQAGYRDAVVRGMDYLLGRNALNISYVTGYGDVYAQNQHSRWYSASLDPSLPHPPDGTIAGGPNSTTLASGDPVAATTLGGCVAQFCYLDQIGSWSTNEITVNWNAPMSWVSSFVADADSGGAVGYASCQGAYRSVPGHPSVGVMVVQGARTFSFDWPGAQTVRAVSPNVSVSQQGTTVTVTSRYMWSGWPTVAVLAVDIPWGTRAGPERFWVGGKPCRSGG